MPYKSEKIPLPEHLDRRRKLTAADKAVIEARYKNGGVSLNALAQEYGVCKKTIQLIVNPEIKAKNDQHIKDNWKKYQTYGEEHAKIMREYRRYKQSLFVKHEIG